MEEKENHLKFLQFKDEKNFIVEVPVTSSSGDDICIFLKSEKELIMEEVINAIENVELLENHRPKNKKVLISPISIFSSNIMTKEKKLNDFTKLNFAGELVDIGVSSSSDKK